MALNGVYQMLETFSFLPLHLAQAMSCLLQQYLSLEIFLGTKIIPYDTILIMRHYDNP